LDQHTQHPQSKGAYGANPNGIDSGKAYIIFGKTDTNAVDLAKLGGDSKYTIDLAVHVE
jgi:hypothetical protein